MEPMPNIPTPAHLVWREVRHRAVPFLVFAGALSATVILWRQQAVVPHLVGQVESITSSVTTIDNGIITALHVERLQQVEKGQAIAEFRVSDPEEARAQLAKITAQLQVLESRLTEDHDRLLQGYEQLRLNWLQQRVSLATARAELQYAESDFARISKLYSDKLVTDNQFDRARMLADSRRAEVTEREKLVAQIKENLDHLSPDDANRYSTALSEKLNQEITAAENRLQLTMTLTAPISGLVTSVQHQAGERVARSESLVTITAIHPRQIIGYLRTPTDTLPKVGDVVTVRTRELRRQVGMAHVLRVGHHYEPIAANLVTASPKVPFLGLPVLISIPENLNLMPGQIVDLALKAP